MVEIKETKDKKWTVVDKEKVECKTLGFKLFPTEEDKKTLFDISSHQRWIWNACVNVFQQENDIDDLKKILDKEREDIKKFNLQYTKAKSIKNVEEREKELKKLKKPKVTKFKYKDFRDNLKKYRYIETEIGRTTDGKEIILQEYEYIEDNNAFPSDDDWFTVKHNRIPRGAVFGFISSLNSNIANYRNNERDFTINYKTKKSKNETIYFEDKSYPKLIDKIRNKYCYTKIVNGQRKRLSLTLKEIKEYLDIQSFTIVHDKSTNQYYLNLSVPINFYLPEDKRSENQTLFVEGSMVAGDPGLRTFLMCYTVDKTISFGDGCCDKIFTLLKLCDKITITKEMTEKQKEEKYKEKQLIRNTIKCMVDDLHWKVIKYLTSNYETIIYPDFRTQGMMQKLNKENRRNLSALSFFKFKQRLIYKCKTNKNVLIIMNEAYTSRTCSCCGFLNAKSTDKTFHCKNCKYEIDRDINGARNIMIKTLGILYKKPKDMIYL